MLINYKLFDPITRLTLLINENPKSSTLKIDKSIIEAKDNDKFIDNLQDVSHNMANLANKYKYSRSDFQWSAYRTIIYELAKILNHEYQLDEKENIVNWTGEYYPDLHSCIINPHHDGIYYIKELADENSNQIKFDIYHTSYEDSNKLIDMVLNESRNLQFIPNYKAFNALKDFWLAQSEDANINHQAEIKAPNISKALNEVLSHVIEDQAENHKLNLKLQSLITYQKLLDFYNEVQNQKITDKTKDVQDWLFNSHNTISSVYDMLRILKIHENYNNFIKSMDTPLTEIESINIINELKKDKYFPKTSNLNIVIYPIKQPIKQYQPKNKHLRHFTGVHGTNAFSIPTILCDGLKSMHELQHDSDAEYDETGQALGDGTYFARVDQASKALSYSSRKFNRQYLLVADISYVNAITVKGYNGRQNRKYDFVEAPAVGNRHGYDEYVAVHPQQQVNLKYLIEISKVPL